MATARYAIEGYGQIELNNCAFRRDGRIEAQCKLDDTDFASVPAENGMILAIHRDTRTVTFPDFTTGDSGTTLNADQLFGLNYSSEHIYDERTPGLKNFKLERNSFLPRLGYLAVGDKFTTNCVSRDTSEFATDVLLKAATDAFATTAVYGGVCADGSILLSANKPSAGPVLQVVDGKIGMPDGTYGVMLQVLSV